MKNAGKIQAALRLVRNYTIFLLTISFIITCSTVLFVSTLAETLDLTLTAENLNAAAKLTMLNIFFLSFIFFLIDTVRRKLTVDMAVKRITDGAKCIIDGDFSVRLKKQSRFGTDESFNRIIDCFNKMAEELGSVETLRTDFIANVSHEMKTPLAVLRSYATLLQDSDLPEEKRIEYAKGITNSTVRMSDMLTNILKLNRLENGQIHPNFKEFDLGEEICASLLQYENVWEDKGIELDTDIAEDVIINSDSELLALVWNNLFSNALKFTDCGGRVFVGLTADEKSATVTVKDSGCGMSAEVGGRIFEKFYQGDTSHSSAGNGLGLALVKRVIDIMHAEICVESVVGEGSTFTVKLRRS